MDNWFAILAFIFGLAVGAGGVLLYIVRKMQRWG